MHECDVVASLPDVCELGIASPATHGYGVHVNDERPHNGVMRSLLAALVLAAAPLGATPALAAPAPTLTIRVDLGVGQWEQWTLGCSPTRGTQPNRIAACIALTKQGMRMFTPVPKDAVCTMIYGGPERATVTGTWRGSRVKTVFDRSNGCEIARWQRAKALFSVPGTSVIRGSVSLGPTCAVQQVGQDCTEPSVAAIVRARTADGRELVSAAVAGRGFAMRLPHGTWAITADAGMHCAGVDVRMPADATQPGITIACDTGLR